jgi:hypothetical protein
LHHGGELVLAGEREAEEQQGGLHVDETPVTGIIFEPVRNVGGIHESAPQLQYGLGFP